MDTSDKKPEASTKPHSGEQKWVSFLLKATRECEKVLTWREENLVAELNKQGFVGGDQEDILDYWRSLRGSVASNKSWTFGGRVDEKNYWVDPSKLQLPALERRVVEGGCALVQAAYRSGKSTHLYALYRKLLLQNQYFPIIITMPYFNPNNITKDNFWEVLTHQLRSYFSDVNISSAEEFKSLFSYKSFGARKIVLLFDEFQSIVGSEIMEPLLASFKVLRDGRELLYSVHTILCFGTYSLDLLTNEEWRSKYSPFPKENTIYIKPLPTADTRAMFTQFGNDVNVTFTDAVMDDICQTTNGYAGIVGFVGLQLANAEDLMTFRPPQQSFRIDMVWWIQFRSRIPEQLAHQEQFKKLVRLIEKEEGIRMLAWYFLGLEEPFMVESEHTEYACVLGDYGLIRFDPLCFKWNISSLYLRELIYLTSRKAPAQPWPKTILDNPRELVTHVLQDIDKPLFKRTALNKTTGFPSEFAFQGEAFAVIRASFKLFPGEEYFVMLEAKLEGKRADLLAKNGKKIIFEFKSAAYFWSTASTLTASVEQAASYAMQHSADYAILVNFVPHNRGDLAVAASYSSSTNKVVHVFQVLCDANYNMTLLER